MHAPTDARFLNQAEWAILTGVFGSTLPFRQRILLTNMLGGGNRPFTIPTSAISLLLIPAAIQAALTGLVLAKLGSTVGGALSSASNFLGLTGPGALASQVSGMANLGYLVNVGPAAFPNLAINHDNLLVHELTHVWQGKNGRSSMTYVNNSIMQQCRADFSTSSHHAAYSYTPGGNWSAYNAEQQASIVEDWYASGQPTSGPLWPYVRDKVRNGII